MPDAADFHAARSDPSRAVLEGFHAIKHAIRFGAQFEVVCTRDRDALDALAARMAPDVRAELMRLATTVSPARFAELAPAPPETGVIGMARRRVTTMEQLAALPPSAPIVLLESPSHPGNTGAAIRVAAGAGAVALVTTGPGDPWHPTVIRGSAGLHYALPVARFDGAGLPGRVLVAVDPDGTSLDATAIPSHAILAFGSERAGLSDDLRARADATVRIPMEPGVSSLNLATAVAVILYAWRLRRDRAL